MGPQSGWLAAGAVLFNFANTPFARTEFHQLSWTPYEVSRGAAQLDLGPSIDPYASRKAHLEFNTDLFDRASAERWISLIPAADGKRLPSMPKHNSGRVSILTGQEQHRMLREWNATDRPVDPACVLSIVRSRRSADAPDAVAVRLKGGKWSYAEFRSSRQPVSASFA